MPSRSPGRIGRVVYETENSRAGNSVRRRRVSVVLPAPDGDETMTSTPRRASPGRSGPATSSPPLASGLLSVGLMRRSFDVLDLLAHLLELGLGGDHPSHDLDRR